MVSRGIRREGAPPELLAVRTGIGDVIDGVQAGNLFYACGDLERAEEGEFKRILSLPDHKPPSAWFQIYWQLWQVFAFLQLGQPAEAADAWNRMARVAFLELKCRYREVPFDISEAGGEIDFIVRDPCRGPLRIQVTTALNEDNETRELGAFLAADRRVPAGENLLLSLDRAEGGSKRSGTSIRRKNLLRWLLGEAAEGAS